MTHTVTDTDRDTDTDPYSDTDTEWLNSGRDDEQAAGLQPVTSPASQADTWVFQLDLGAHGIAIDLTDPAWPQQMDQSLYELAPLLPTEMGPGQGHAAAETSGDMSDDSCQDASDERPASPLLGASVHDFVNARTVELVDQGAVSILLLPTGSALAPVAVGAVFVQHLRSGTVSRSTAALQADGWTVEAPGAEPVERVRSPNVVLRGRRSVSIPGIAGLVLNEQVAILSTDDSVVTVIVQGASSQTPNDLPDSALTATVKSARLEKN